MSSIISLNGQFKADIYNNSNELVSKGEYASNFITCTGLLYPLTMPFVDTFKYLSLGSGTQPSHLHTTGLYSGCQPHIYSTNGKSPDGQNFLWTTGVVGSACGYKTHPGGVEIFRGWRIPEDGKSFLDEDLHVGELMCTPGSPPSNGSDGGGLVYTKRGNYFNDQFSGITAFNRLLTEFTIPSGDYAIITYKLDFGIDSAVKTFDPFIGLNNAAGNSKVAWQALTGVSRVLHPGIKLIASSEIAEGGEGEAETSAGDSYQLGYGEPLEPYKTGNLYAYFSSDNTQFRFDQYWGGQARTGLQRLTDDNGVHHWGGDIDIASGVPEYFWNFPEVLENKEEQEKTDVPKTPQQWQTNPTRATKFQQFRREGSTLPTASNVNSEFTASEMGNQGYNSSVVVTSLNHDIAINYTGQIDYRRDRNITRVLGWQAINAVADPAVPGTFVKYKSLVFCANSADPPKEAISSLDKEYAFFDSQFGVYDSTNHPDGGFHHAIFGSTGIWPYGANDNKPTYSQPLGTICSNPKYTTETTCEAPKSCSDLQYTTQVTCEAPGVCSNTTHTTKTACTNAGATWTSTHTWGSTHVWGPKEYPYQDNQNGLSLTWRLSWSAPCGDVPGSCMKDGSIPFYSTHGDIYVTKTTCEAANGVWTDCVEP